MNTKHAVIGSLGEEYYASMPTLGEALADVLAVFGCQEIYGIGGDYAAPLINALDGRFPLCSSANEMHAGFSACAAAELGKLGVCLATYTVGTLPCATAAALAQAERLPVVFLSGAPAETELSDRAIHHTLCRSDSWRVDYDNALKAFSALGLRAERLQGQRNPAQPHIAGEQFLRLVRHAWVRREPVMIEVPRDLLDTKTQGVELPTNRDTLGVDEPSFTGLDAIARHVKDRLRSSATPVLVFGEKVKLNPRLLRLLVAFCERFQVPFASNIYAKGILGDEHPLSLGTYNGVFSKAATRDYVERRADFILEIGTSTYPQDVSNALNTDSNVVATFENKVTIIGTSALERDEIAFFEHMLTADVTPKRFARTSKLSAVPGGKGEARDNAADARDDARDDSRDDRSEASNDIGGASGDDPLGVRQLFDVLEETQSRSARPFIFLPEIGSAFFSSFTLTTHRSSLGRSWLTNPWYGAMGTSLPYARTVCRELKRADADDVAVVLIGDGGFQFQSNELIHFLRDDLDVVIVYLSNGCFQLGKCSDSSIYECVDERFDVGALVRAYGGKSVRCESAGEFAGAFDDATAHPPGQGIQLIEAVLDTRPENESAEMRAFNTYIRAKAGIPDAVKAWQRFVGDRKSRTAADV